MNVKHSYKAIYDDIYEVNYETLNVEYAQLFV